MLFDGSVDAIEQFGDTLDLIDQDGGVGFKIGNLLIKKRGILVVEQLEFRVQQVKGELCIFLFEEGAFSHLPGSEQKSLIEAGVPARCVQT